MIISKQNKQWILKAFLIYIVGLALFSLVGDHGLVTSYRLWNQGQKLDQEIESLHQDIQNLNEQVQDFRSNDRTIEQYAREKMNMVGDHEIQYIFR